MSELKSLNNQHAQKQNDLYAAYLKSIEPETEEFNNLLQEYNEEFKTATAIPKSIYDTAVAPDLQGAAEIVNPKVVVMKAELQKIKEEAVRKTNKVLKKFAEFQKEIEEQFLQNTKVYKAQYDAECAEAQAVLDKQSADAQDRFDRLVKTRHELYIKQAEKLEQEFETMNKTHALSKADNGKSDPEMRGVIGNE